MPGRTDPVQSVTTARASRSDDVDHRTRVYLAMMAVRTVCFLVAVLAPLPLWARMIFVAGAVVLPYAAVVRANHRGSSPGVNTPVPQRRKQQLAATAATDSDGVQVIPIVIPVAKRPESDTR